MNNNGNENAFYEQVGVAMTCRSFEEYLRMFSLDENELKAGPLLDVAAGASSFAAEACARGLDVSAADPLYAMTPEAIRIHGEEEIASSTEKIKKLADRFLWTYYGDPERHRQGREQSLRRFLDHYGGPERGDRYTPAYLPALPYKADTFHRVLCSHFLFLYGEQFDYNFHLEAVLELLRVCRPGGEVRVYPLLDLRWNRYPELDRLILSVERTGAKADLLPSQLPFIPGSSELLRLRK